MHGLSGQSRDGQWTQVRARLPTSENNTHFAVRSCPPRNRLWPPLVTAGAWLDQACGSHVSSGDGHLEEWLPRKPEQESLGQEAQAAGPPEISKDGERLLCGISQVLHVGTLFNTNKSQPGPKILMPWAAPLPAEPVGNGCLSRHTSSCTSHHVCVCTEQVPPSGNTGHSSGAEMMVSTFLQ